MQAAKLYNLIEKGFLEPFYHFLDTGENKLSAKVFMEFHGAIMVACDQGSGASSVLKYAKKILQEFCSDYLVANMINLKEDALL